MKIGIISINLYTKWLNLACPLHSYAMQEFLAKNGYDCKVIDYKASYYDNFNMRHPSEYFEEKYRSKLNRFPAKKEKRAEWFENIAFASRYAREYKALYNERASRYDKFKNFIDTRLKVSEKEYNSVSMEFEDPGFDCYMCVTDVIWKSAPSLERAFFLANKCMDNKIKIAYSASRGSSYTKDEEQKALFFRYLSDFDAISVREPSLEAHIKENSDIEATTVLDPVMLHDKSFYEDIAEEPEEKGYMFLYHVVQDADDTIEQAVKYAKAHNLTIIESSDRPYPEGKLTKYKDVEHKWIYDIGIEQWLGYIKNAECVFTNSFHCCCLSIIFGKNFFAGLRNGDKVDTVLSTFGLENRRFDMDTDILGNDPGDIDYEKVHARLAEKRKESGDWLLEALRKAESNPKPEKDYDTARKEVTYPVICNFNIPTEGLTLRQRAEASPELRTAVSGINNGETVFTAQKPAFPGYRFLGWTLRCRIDNDYYRFTKDGGFAPWDKTPDEKCKIYNSGSIIPHIPANGIVSVVADALWEKLTPTFAISFNSKLKATDVTAACNTEKGELNETKSGAYEYRLNNFYKNTGSYKIPGCPFTPVSEDMSFKGWTLRFWMDEGWYWYMNDSTAVPTSEISEADKKNIQLFAPGEIIPQLPGIAISNVVFCAEWYVHSYNLAYHSGTLKAEAASCIYDENLGNVKTTEKGAFEYALNAKISAEGSHSFMANGFISNDESESYAIFTGWYLRAKIGDVWKWHLEDGTFVKMDEYSPTAHGPRKVFSAGEKIIVQGLPEAADLIAVATWKFVSPEALHSLAYHSGTLKSDACNCIFDGQFGNIKVTPKGAYEYLLYEKVITDGTLSFAANGYKAPKEEGIRFKGWYLRAKCDNVWKWYLEDGTLVDMNEYSQESHGKRKIFAAGEAIEALNLPENADLIAVATWKKKK